METLLLPTLNAITTVPHLLSNTYTIHHILHISFIFLWELKLSTWCLFGLFHLACLWDNNIVLSFTKTNHICLFHHYSIYPSLNLFNAQCATALQRTSPPLSKSFLLTGLCHLILANCSQWKSSTFSKQLSPSLSHLCEWTLFQNNMFTQKFPETMCSSLVQCHLSW